MAGGAGLGKVVGTSNLDQTAHNLPPLCSVWEGAKDFIQNILCDLLIPEQKSRLQIPKLHSSAENDLLKRTNGTSTSDRHFLIGPSAGWHSENSIFLTNAYVANPALSQAEPGLSVVTDRKIGG